MRPQLLLVCISVEQGCYSAGAAPVCCTTVVGIMCIFGVLGAGSISSTQIAKRRDEGEKRGMSTEAAASYTLRYVTRLTAC